ncbi:hypothetical protein BKA00_007202 [Actinomadura coerulea]|uniref:SRPBCC family protein n=1 Tax=Actinomadura coerulea TaxID=46159 RepID=A0A7X0G6E9_9ACTN|nr:hypothetical protein [Actinomadura coerulea]MBB6400288.1 hypothetical protein [Actinomadura coerulea]
MADLDTVRHLRVMAASLPGATYAEKVLARSLEEVWAVAGDLETGFPMLLGDVRTMRIAHADGERLEVIAVGRLGQRARFDVVIRPGWCWMQSRFLHGGMAAAPEGEGTRVAFLGALRIPGMRLADPILRTLPLGGRVLRRLEARLQARAAG